MTQDERAELESRAERAKRRGEMAEALSLLQQVATAFPQDTGLSDRLALLRDSLQPMELQSAKTKFDVVRAGGAPASPEQEGERLFSLGDYAGAAAAYRRALTAKPDSQLIKERLFELFRLAQAAPRHSPTDRSLPKNPEELLQALLDRISSRRRRT